MMTTIYLVTEGEYSEYRVVAAYSTRALAEARAVSESNEHHEARVEEFPLDTYVDEIGRGLKFWYVWMAATGDGKVTAFQSTPGSMRSSVLHGGPVGFTISFGDVPRGWRWEGWAKTREDAIKIANEQRIYALANEQVTKKAEPEDPAK